jgi:hypothetical protein
MAQTAGVGIEQKTHPALTGVPQSGISKNKLGQKQCI